MLCFFEIGLCSLVLVVVSSSLFGRDFCLLIVVSWLLVRVAGRCGVLLFIVVVCCLLFVASHVFVVACCLLILVVC